MPDSARLVAALCLGALGYLLSDMIRALFEEEINFGYFNFVNLGLGLLVGWTLVGKRAGRGIVFAINNGVTGVIAFVFLGVFVQGANEMLRLALRNRYDDAFEAILAAFELSFGYLVFITTAPTIFVALAGGVLAGLITEVVWHKWR